MYNKVPIILLLLVTNAIYSQRGFELGGWIGVSEYFGDLQTELKLTDISPAMGIALRYNFDDRIAVKSSINRFSLRANDNDSPNSFERNRNLQFTSINYDWTNQLEFNFLSFKHGSKDYFFTPYLLGGFSIFSYNPQTTLEGNRVNLRDFGTEGQALGAEYGRFNWAYTYGIGLKWALNYDWSINVELGIRNANTDYLDDVSTVYPDPMELSAVRGLSALRLSNPAIVPGIGDAGRQRGNSKNNDTYVLFEIGLMRYFGQLDCPKFLKRRN